MLKETGSKKKRRSGPLPLDERALQADADSERGMGKVLAALGKSGWVVVSEACFSCAKCSTRFCGGCDHPRCWRDGNSRDLFGGASAVMGALTKYSHRRAEKDLQARRKLVRGGSLSVVQAGQGADAVLSGSLGREADPIRFRSLWGSSASAIMKPVVSEEEAASMCCG